MFNVYTPMFMHILIIVPIWNISNVWILFIQHNNVFEMKGLTRRTLLDLMHL